MSEQPCSRTDQTLTDSQLPPSAPLGPVTLSVPPATAVLPTLASERGNDPAAAPRRLGRFEVQGEIGRGGMGAVLRGRDPALGRELALKVLLTRCGDREALRRFQEEAQIGGQLQHPSLVPVYELGTDGDGRPFFAMKLVDGKTLSVQLKERKTLADDLPRFLTILEQVCQAVGYAHARGVIHRDLKPANIMVGAFGEVQVMDWGLAKVLGKETRERQRPEQTAIHTARTESGGTESRDGSVLGTPAYMAPEQARGEIDRLDARTDVFGLGAILCEVLTGQPVFTGASVADILGRAARGDLAETYARLDGSGADAELVRLAKACLAPEAAARPRDGGEVAAQVTAYRAGVAERLRASELERTAATVKAREERKRRRLALALAASVVLLLVLGGGVFTWIRQQRLEREAERLRQEAELVRQTENDLSRAALARQEKKWPDAWKAMERAEERLASGGSEELRERVQQARAELERVRKDQIMVARLIEARLKGSTINPYQAKSGSAADTAFREAFAEYGLDVENLTPELAGEKIRQSAIRDELVCALYDWAGATIEFRSGAWQPTPRGWRLVHLAEKNDPDPWRKQFVEPVEKRDRAMVLRLAKQADPVQLSPLTACYVAGCLILVGKGEKAVALLQEVHRRHPDDFQLNVELARSYLYYAKPFRPDEAARYYTAASVLRPNTAQVYSELGNALRRHNKLPEAIAALHEAIRINPDCSSAYFYLGLALLRQGKPGEAKDAFRKNLSLEPDTKDSKERHNNLGAAFMNQGKLADAAAEYNESIRLDPEHALPHYRLGWVLRRQGKFKHSLASFERAQELVSRTRWNITSAQTAQAVRDAKRLVELEGKLPGLRKGETKPADANEQMELGLLCLYKRLYAESVAFYHAGFRAKPALATYLASAHRYNAACSAARAGTGQGEDAAALSEAERVVLRKDALDWLRALLVLAQKKAESDKPQDRAAVVQAIQHLQRDPHLAAVRDAIDKLPEAERPDWRKLWQDVEALRQRADVPK